MKAYVVMVNEWYEDDGYDSIDSIWSDKESALIRIWEIVNEIIEQNWYEYDYLMPGVDYSLEYECYIPSSKNDYNVKNNKGCHKAVFNFNGYGGTVIEIEEHDIDKRENLPAYFTTT